MIKILILFSLIYSSIMYSQNSEFIYARRVCDNFKLIEERLYSSKTGIYKEINYDRNTFHDTTNINKEIFEAYIPLELDQKKSIYSLLNSTKLKENTLIYGSLEKSDYIEISLFFYENAKLINNSSKYLNRKNKTEDFETLLSLVLNFIQSSEQYNKTFYWHNEKK
ncbi:hypothetical protein C1637_04115 [Chryseobacterium lactis]|uniref:Uncharacterized protein n=1 Tax=Chryseobacterium lactis TaxID=1241981 RepID=A0A3G6RUQ6_CHRLC|nr:hypothetical protein [Chryseobacterium lactis]AZA81769.1 hypothetical protein EG342_07510 [Chryseobacterium lactis]AZB06767.1 hypothetical protein EG341_23630 [Chryseobacterium lactis]PNW15618.1 hypothetical protein C1637_04115 [Chryseobacterium lactis]